MTGRAWTRVEVSHVIVRACARCQHPREIGEPCAGCGNPEPPVVHDLGVQAYTHRNPLKRWAWHLAGQHLAARRARQAAKYVTGKGA
jgi:hypothetical protein